jgi:hypothetical protein
MYLQFRTRNIASTRGFLSIAECSEIVRAMKEAPREPAQVVRAGESILDQSLRFCFDHHFPDAFKRPIGDRMAAYFVSIQVGASFWLIVRDPHQDHGVGELGRICPVWCDVLIGGVSR